MGPKSGNQDARVSVGRWLRRKWPRTVSRSVCGAVVVGLIRDLPLGSRLKDRNLVRRGWHSVQREGRGGRPLCYTTQAQDGDLVRADWETRNFILR